MEAQYFEQFYYWHPSLAHFTVLQLDRPAFQLTSPFLRGE